MKESARLSVLSGVRRGRESSWSTFYDIYYQYLRDVCIGRGISWGGQIMDVSWHDAEDIVQELMAKVHKEDKIEKYDKQRGAKFRTYLCMLLKDRMKSYGRRRYKVLDQELSDKDIEKRVDSMMQGFDKYTSEVWASKVEKLSKEMLRENVDPLTYQIFDSLVEEKKTVSEVADFFDVSKNNIYQIKDRTKKMLGKYINQISEEL